MSSPKVSQHNNSKLSMFLAFLCFTGLTFGGEMNEACEVMYHGDVLELDKSTVVVPEEIVAISSKIIVNTPTEVVETNGGTPSLFFIIDHSGSMFHKNNPQDRWGHRFKVAFALIDSIYDLFKDAEVGVAVFRENLYFDPTDETRFAKTPKQAFNGYLPLFKLDSSYQPDGMMGYEIVKKYLDYDTITEFDSSALKNNEYVDLKYRPSNHSEIKVTTNITAGFHAAQHAFKSATNAKNRHFIIFLSDGNATAPLMTPNQYIDDVKSETPTTFTVFFTDNPNPPQDLVNMTKNIMENKYSLSNDKSKLWTIDMGSEKLLDFLMENVLDVISSKIISQPEKITLAGASMTDFKGGSFTFDDHFPLMDVTTPFAFDIDYTVAKDTIIDSKPTIVESKLSLSGDFKVKVVDGSPLPDDYPNKFTMKCWERGLSFHNGDVDVKITQAKETDNDLKIKFTWKPGEADYKYTNATVELITVAGNKQDRETLKLDKKTGYFIKDFDQEILNPNENPTQGDNKIQHYADDMLIAIFKNNEKPKLVLDTIRDTLLFKLSGYIKPQEAYYYDRKFGDGSKGADGYIDSIFIRVETDIDKGINKDHLKEIMDEKLIVLPDFRDFKITKYLLKKDGFSLEVEESRKHDPVTYIRDDDEIKIKGLILKTGGWMKKNTIPIFDKVAPIIIRKEITYENKKQWTPFFIDYQVDSIQDTLIVIFSEPVRKITHIEPFYFWDTNEKKKYTAKAKDDDVVNDKQVKFKFAVTDIVMSGNDKKTIISGDSIWIHDFDRIADLCDDEDGDETSNFQKQKKNTRRVINVIQKLVPFEIQSLSSSPVSFTTKDSTSFVPVSVIELFKKNKALEDLNLEQDGGDHIGMTIQVVPEVEDILSLPHMLLEGTLSIIDPVGNYLVKKKGMLFNPDLKLKTLNYIWNGKNSAGRAVGSGTYMAITYTTRWPIGKGDGKPKTKKVETIFLGVKK